jgi:hypothetical protein
MADKVLRPSIPGWAEEIVLQLLLRLPKKTAERYAKLVERLVIEGMVVERRDGRDAARKHIAESFSKFDPRQGGDHDENNLRRHALLAWQHLKNFPFRARSLDAKMLWLKEHLPELFDSLKMWSCGDRCPKVTTIPEPQELNGMAAARGIKQLVAKVVAYHHRLTANTVEHRLYRRHSLEFWKPVKNNLQRKPLTK